MGWGVEKTRGWGGTSPEIASQSPAFSILNYTKLAKHQENTEIILAFRQLLADLNLSQKKFASIAGVHESTVSDWLTGKHPVPKLVIEYLELRLSIQKLLRS